MITALEELKKTGTIFSYEILEIKEGRKIVDVKYTVTPIHELRYSQIWTRAINCYSQK